MQSNNFRIEALPRRIFAALLKLNDVELADYHARWLAISHLHHVSNSPYKAAGPIFVREHCETARLNIGEIPTMLRHRLLSLRAYDDEGIMVCADVVKGVRLEHSIVKQFQIDGVRTLHIHNAGPGCFNCAVHRAS